MDGRLVGVEAATRGSDGTDRRAALFRLLASGRWWSVAALAAALHPDADRDTRVAVGDALRSLEASGMALRFDGTAVIGEAFVPLDPGTLERHLASISHDRWDTRVVFETGSTNTDLLRDARVDGSSRVPRILVAELQHAGKGRLGRSWISAPGASITASFALPIARSLAELDGVTLACGLAVQRVVAACGVACRLKWPNDLLLDGRKLAGILVEAHDLRGSAILVVGVGLNVGPATGGANAESAASLRAAGATPLDRNRLVAELAVALRTDLATFERHGFAAFAARWNAEDAFDGRAVTIGTTDGPSLTGIAHGVDERGALLVDVGGVRTTVVAGDVSLRPAIERDAT